ncbi:copine-3-like, partial [Plakobranchus ocellatus]
MAAAPGVYPGYGPAGSAASLVQKVELRLACKNLPNKDIGSKSDPCAVFYFKVGDKFKE